MSSTRRVAVITGGGRGIGAATAGALAAVGVVPVLVDLAEDSQVSRLLASIAERGSQYGVEPSYRRIDVTDGQAVNDLVDEVVGSYGGLDILVNNAGILSTTPIEELTESEWHRVMNVNLTAAVFCSQAVLPAMRAKGWGRIINIASLAGRMGGITVGCAYAASKAGMIGMTWNLSHVLAGEGITVNAVAPGPVEGAMYSGFSRDEREKLERSIPAGRLGSPEEIASMVAFLASDAAGYITGAVIDANGGLFTG